MVKKAIFPNLKKKVNLFLIINAFFMIPCCALAETVAKWDSEKDLFTVQSNNVTVKDVLNYIESIYNRLLLNILQLISQKYGRNF